MNRPCHFPYALFDLMDRPRCGLAVTTFRRRFGSESVVYVLFDKREVGPDPVRQLIEGRVPSLCIGRSKRLRKRLSQLVCGIVSGKARHGFTILLMADRLSGCSPNDVGVILVSTNHPASMERFLFEEHVVRHGAFPIGNRKAPDRPAGSSGECKIDISWAAIFARHKGAVRV
jgi:hypothetical protein